MMLPCETKWAISTELNRYFRSTSAAIVSVPPRRVCARENRRQIRPLLSWCRFRIYWLKFGMPGIVAPAVRLDLSQPPQIYGQGRGIHGVRRLVDDFRLPELWSLHLYSYYAELEVDGRTFPIAPGLVSLVPPGAQIQYRYRGRSTHLFAHLRVTGRRPTA